MFRSSLLLAFECKIIAVVIFALDWLRLDRCVNEFDKTKYFFIDSFCLLIRRSQNVCVPLACSMLKFVQRSPHSMFDEKFVHNNIRLRPLEGKGKEEGQKWFNILINRNANFPRHSPRARSSKSNIELKPTVKKLEHFAFDESNSIKALNTNDYEQM